MNMKNTALLKSVKFTGVVLAGALACGGAVGCQTDKSSVADFFPSDENRSTQQFITTQAASGARADATLQPLHFDGDKLNSLGQAKLDLMLKDDDSVEPLTVYVNLDEKANNFGARKDAVTNYLVDHGMVKEQIALKTGTNPDATTLSATHIAGMSKTDTGSSGSDDKSAGAGMGSATPSGGGK